MRDLSRDLLHLNTPLNVFKFAGRTSPAAIYNGGAPHLKRNDAHRIMDGGRNPDM